MTPVKKYDQAFINYGPHSNMKLLTEYGFALKSNINNFCPVFLGKINTIAYMLKCSLKVLRDLERLVKVMLYMFTLLSLA